MCSYPLFALFLVLYPGFVPLAAEAPRALPYFEQVAAVPDPHLVEGLLPPALEAVSLASADFDADGVPDLVCGYSGPDGHFVAIHPGNVDSIYPSRPEARLRRAQGTSVATPFGAATRILRIAGRPDFLAAGDFDADDRPDVVVATRGGAAMQFLAGRGASGLQEAETWPVGGTVTALLQGQINRVDSLLDLVVGVHDADGDAVLVFEGPRGARQAPAERFAVPAGVDALALGQILDDSANELVVAAPDELIVIAGRDRRLTLTSDARRAVPPASRFRMALEAPVLALSIGDFLTDDGSTIHELAALLEDGTLRIATREGESRMAIAATLVTADGAGRSSDAVLCPIHVSGSRGIGLAVFDGTFPSLKVLTDDGRIELVDTGWSAAPRGVVPMRLNADGLTDLVMIDREGAIVAAITAIASTITVDSAADSAVAGDGECTLREAIENANSDSDTTSGDCAAGSGADLIGFGIAGGGAAAAIPLTSALPALSDSVTIDGDTQACADPPCIELDGSGTTGADGLAPLASNCVIRGLAIHDFEGHGIFAETPSFRSGLLIEGNTIGLNRIGTALAANGGNGISLYRRNDATVGGTTTAARNVISGNARGISIRRSSDTLVIGNFIGTDGAGSSALAFGNRGEGIFATDGFDVQVGGVEANSGNVVSANRGAGIRASAPQFESFGALSAWGNRIGTDRTGTFAAGNLLDGIVLEFEWVEGFQIGGSTPAARNLVSANGGNGILLNALQYGSPRTIQGNYIGTDVSGSIGMGNALSGIDAYLDNLAIQIGGVVAGTGNVVSGNGERGIYVADCCDILGNRIGTDATGTAAIPNGDAGIEKNGARSHPIGGTDPGAGNLVSGNGGAGIKLRPSSDDGTIVGNLIGVDADGLAAIPNASHGIWIWNAGSTVGSVLVGGPSTGARNVISGNGGSGIFIDEAHEIRIQGNYIGVDVNGSSALGNAVSGVAVLDSGDTLIGGTAGGEGNVITANGTSGVSIAGSSTENTLVRGNRIGTDAPGLVGFPPAQPTGVETGLSTSGTIIGGSAPGAGNVISGHASQGVRLRGVDETVQGNLIGTDVTGMAPLGNSVGVEAESAARIGGTASGEGNLISGNGYAAIVLHSDSVVQGNRIGLDASGSGVLGNQWGVQIVGAHNTIGGPAIEAGNAIVGSAGDGISVLNTQNEISRSSIHSNGLLGIDLEYDGVTANDYQDPDFGANMRQNYPELVSASATPAAVTVVGSLNSVPLTDYRVEFFSSASCNPSGHGEGDRFLGSVVVGADANGDAALNVALTAGASNGEAITATATDPNGNTSEFSSCVTATCDSSVPFDFPIRARDGDTLFWFRNRPYRFVKGTLADVGSYATLGGGWDPNGSEIDISYDAPLPGEGLYYVVRPLACGSWQTSLGEQPGRDVSLP